MNKLKYFVSGHKGLVGSAVVRALRQRSNETDILTADKTSLDLTDYGQTFEFFQIEKPEIVISCAAKVGGINANAKQPADFIRENLLIQTNLLHCAHFFKVQTLIFLGSSCVYPKNNQIPITEDHLLTGELEITNEAYAIAKIAGIKMAAAYNAQYGTDFRNLMPCNLFGLNDNYDPMGSHVIPALIRKFHNAKIKGSDWVEIWGTGKAKREFLYSDDLADAILHVLSMDKIDFFSVTSNRFDLLNIGSGKEITINDLAYLISDIVGFKGKIQYNSKFPDGTLTKLLDCSRVFESGWSPSTSIRKGLELSYADFVKGLS